MLQVGTYGVDMSATDVGSHVDDNRLHTATHAQVSMVHQVKRANKLADKELMPC